MDKPVEVMRLLRVPPSGKLVIEIGGRRFASVADIPAGRGRQMAMAAIGELIVAAGGYQALVDAGFAPPIAPPAVPANPMQSSGPSTTTRLQQADIANALSQAATSADDAEERRKAQFLASLENRSLRPSEVESLPTEEGDDKPASFFGRLRGRRSRPKPAEVTSPLIDIPGQINAVLQRRLLEEPELANRAIKIDSDSFGALQIHVDGRVYEDAVQIQDPLVRFVIRMSIQDWENDQLG